MDRVDVDKRREESTSMLFLSVNYWQTKTRYIREHGELYRRRTILKRVQVRTIMKIAEENREEARLAIYLNSEDKICRRNKKFQIYSISRREDEIEEENLVDRYESKILKRKIANHRKSSVLLRQRDSEFFTPVLLA